MLSALVGIAAVVFTPPQPWALGVAAAPRLPFMGDVDGDGFADLVVVYPEGESIVDVIPSVEGVKSGNGFQALPRWAGKCAAATVGLFDETKGADVAGLFGNVVKIAGGFREGRFQNLFDAATLPRPLSKPALATLGRDVLVYSTETGEGFRIDPRTHTPTPVALARGLVWVGDAGEFVAAQDRNGTVVRLDPKTLRTVGRLGKGPKASRPAAGRGWVAFGDTVWTPNGTAALLPSKLSDAPTVRAAGDVDADGDDDLVEFRYGPELHTGNEVTLRRFVTPGETDPDHDGLTNEEEARLGTDPMNPDTDGDGLLDGWEVKGVRGLDLPMLGCDPRHADLVCLVSRYDGVDPARYAQEFERVTKFYADLPTKNPDGKTGFHFVKIDLDPVKGDDTKSSWQANRAKLRPAQWQGIVHWMQVTPGGGGQADELGDGGTCGEGALWAVFCHEFGHQLGLNHEGFWPNGSCPIYSSMMNYNYSYSFEDSRDMIHYSDGSLVGYTLRETDLDETIPLPYDKVKFLSMGPYHYQLKPNGSTTLIDWNWNGVFGEKHIRADINYAYSTNAGTRDTVGKTSVAPWLVIHRGVAYALYGNTDAARTPGGDSTLGSNRPGKLWLRRLKKPFEWDKPILLGEGLIGDPSAISVGDHLVVAMPKADGVTLIELDPNRPDVAPRSRLIDGSVGVVPTMGEFQGHPMIMFWEPTSGHVGLAWLDRRFEPVELPDRSTNPPSLCTDTKTGEMIVAMAQNQDAARPNRWQIRRYRLECGALRPTGMDWVEGEAGGARGTGRLTVLFDASRDAGPKGRIYLFGKGMTDAKTPWSCTYVAMSIADRTVRGGWLVKRYYDEWTQSRSAPAAAWFGGDILWAYRWVGGDDPSDDNLQVGYKALGIQSEPFGDHDDLSLIRNFGAQHSLLTLGRG